MVQTMKFEDILLIYLLLCVLFITTKSVFGLLQLDKKVAQKNSNDKWLEYQHRQEMEKLENLEQLAQRKVTQREKEYQLQHQRLMEGQTHLYSIIKNSFGKVKDVDINQAVSSAYILQCMHNGNPIDEDIMKTIKSKGPTFPIPNLEVTSSPCMS